MLFIFLFQNGPYHVTEPITTSPPSLYQNTFTWNNITNMIWLESPCGVGFTYCDTAAGLRHNDSLTAAQNLQAMITFFSLYPELQKNGALLCVHAVGVARWGCCAARRVPLCLAPFSSQALIIH